MDPRVDNPVLSANGQRPRSRGKQGTRLGVVSAPDLGHRRAMQFFLSCVWKHRVHVFFFQSIAFHEIHWLGSGPPFLSLWDVHLSVLCAAAKEKMCCPISVVDRRPMDHRRDLHECSMPRLQFLLEVVQIRLLQARRCASAE
jgi:hypothetical protein